MKNKSKIKAIVFKGIILKSYAILHPPIKPTNYITTDGKIEKL